MTIFTVVLSIVTILLSTDAILLIIITILLSTDAILLITITILLNIITILLSIDVILLGIEYFYFKGIKKEVRMYSNIQIIYHIKNKYPI